MICLNPEIFFLFGVCLYEIMIVFVSVYMYANVHDGI